MSHDMMVLQSWFSPAFPIGAFSYSHGLESAIQKALVDDAASLQNWISVILKNGSGRNDGLFIKAAYQADEEEANSINDLCLSLSGCKERAQETSELGAAFTRAVNQNYGLKLTDELAYPVAVGRAARALDLDLSLTIQSYLQALAASLISVGVRIIPVGQQAGQTCLVKLYPVIEKTYRDCLNGDLDGLGNAAFLAEIMAIKHETATPRLYRT